MLIRIGSSRAQAGNALVVALGVLTLVAATVAVSSVRATAVLQESNSLRYDISAIGAVEAIIAKQEMDIVNLAEAGDPGAFAQIERNYGSEMFGNCEVRYKIEPVRTASKDVDGNPLAFIANPAPDISWEAPSSNVRDAVGRNYPIPGDSGAQAVDGSGNTYWKTNDSVYLFRISAESRYFSEEPTSAERRYFGDSRTTPAYDWSVPGTWKARAQGVRYVAVNKEPLFRYVIFYAQQGPKGDLELSHGPAINIQGNVHSNGSIYLGAGTEVNQWDAVRPFNGATQLGPDPWSATVTYSRGARVSDNTSGTTYYYEYINNNASTGRPTSQTSYWREIKDGRIRVTGVDGIFRLAKPIMYGRFSQFPMSSPSGVPLWSAPSGAISSVEYNKDITGTPLDGYDGDSGSILLRTFSGGWVNPYRIKRDSELITRALDISTADEDRRINGLPVVGYGNAIDEGNDSRDLERGSTRKWPVLSLAAADDGGFAGYARSSKTGGRVKSLPETLASRPLEGQKLFYPDVYVMSKVRKSQPITTADLTSPAINPLLGSLTAGTVPTLSEPSMANFFAANRERGDDHDHAAPVFWDIASGVETHSTITDYEVPGQYIRYAIDGVGGANMMKRIMDSAQGFIGWQVTDANGASVAMASKVGLMIRERPVPDFNYWGEKPDGTPFSDRPYGDKNYLPWAYGKHKDTSVWPFTELYVAGTHTNNRKPSPFPPTSNASLAGENPTLSTCDPNYTALVNASNSSRMTNLTGSSQQYIIDADNPGHIRMTAAAKRGGNTIDPVTSSSADLKIGVDDNGYFRDNWRVVHLKRENVSSSVGPVVNMGDSSTYFDADTFQSVQARLLPDASTNALITGGSSDQQLAGLMIRPVDHTAYGMGSSVNLSSKALNGRDPFVALVVSPRRGIVLQRRLEPSRIRWIAVSEYQRYFTGTNDGSGSETANLGCINTPNQAVLTQLTPRVAAVAPTYNAPQYYNSGIVRQPSTGYWNWQEVDGATTFSKTLTKAQGEGSVSQSFTFSRGPYINRWRWQAYKYWQKYTYRTVATAGTHGYVDLSITGAGAGGLVDFFTTMNTAPGDVGWRDGFSGRTFWLNTVWGGGPGSAPTGSGTQPPTIQNYVAPNLPYDPGQGFIANATHRWRYLVDNNTRYSGANTNYSDNSVYEATENTLGTSSDVFRDSAFNNAVTFLGSEAAVLANLSSNGISAAINLATVPKPSGPTTEPHDPTEPAQPGDPGVGTAPTVPDFGSSPMTFAVTRDNQATTAQPIEYNSWISARGTWFASPTTRFQDVSGNGSDRITPTSYPIDDQYVPSIADPGSSSSLRPDYWTGPAKASPSWSDMYSPTDTNDGSIVPGTSGYTAAALLNSGGSTNQQLYEDAQIPYWASSTSYRAENAVSLLRASVVIYNGVFYTCTATHTAATANRPDKTGAPWVRADHVWLRIEKTGSLLSFLYHIGDSAIPVGDWRWREVTEARVRNADGSAADPDPVTNMASRVTIPSSWSHDWVVGPCLQSGHATTTATADFSNLVVEDTSDTSTTSPGRWDYEDWENGVETINTPVDPASLAGRIVNNTTKYLCSQYQVFWGPLDITEDFFSYTTDNTSSDSRRLATEVWCYNPREFWSQSAWWNEGDLDSSWLPVPSSQWLYKETGTTTAPAALPNSNTASSWVEYAARATMFNINLGNLQTYLRNRTLAQAAYKWSTDSSQGITSGDALRSRFTGLIYAARTNRYPRNPLPGRDNPWNPDLPNTTTNTAMTHGVTLADLYVDQPATPSARQQAVRSHLVPDGASERPPLAPPLRSEEFIHGVMISNGSAVNWGYQSPAVLGQSNTSIVTPNQLYLWGDLNNTLQTVRLKAGATTTADKYTPLAVMGDAVTLLSNNWTLDNYQRIGLRVDTRKVINWNNTTLSQLNGKTAANTTSYRTCILTNNQPTTKYRVFMGEGAPFINTMQFIENWDGKTMNFTGSLVVLDSCRYTRAFLLQDARTYGRSPFGIMGWHANSTWASLTGYAGTTPHWCRDTSNNPLPYTGNSNSTTDPYGAPNVYKPPTRNMTFNEDLLKEEGTPPNTPFGVSAAGVAGWTKSIR
jgi:Tfp pilus assembly protein PilX